MPLPDNPRQRISPIPVGAGVALPDGVADGGGGALVTIVGVGTGGSVSGGNGASESCGRPPGAEEDGSRVTGALREGAATVARGGREP